MSSFFESDSLQLGYGNQVVISDLKISLESSKNYEIIGKNGSGKTTLLMCISNNFIGNTFNSDIKRNNNTLMEIGSMPSLIPMLSLIENINYFLFKENIKESLINKILIKYELNNFKEDLIEDFSSGMIKRSEIAIADLKNPDVLCIDEPKVYLDENGIQLLLALLKKRESDGNSSILSSQESIIALDNIEKTFDLND
ncbi:MAG: ATP-binding cassette domain-containing protein [Candidatus Actinomarina sp.]|tara:strand:- start:1760 stop:2353 length:594 start_codon:yes stop_codon:yes gene_type:complete